MATCGANDAAATVEAVQVIRCCSAPVRRWRGRRRLPSPCRPAPGKHHLDLPSQPPFLSWADTQGHDSVFGSRLARQSIPCLTTAEHNCAGQACLRAVCSARDGHDAAAAGFPGAIGAACPSHPSVCLPSVTVGRSRGAFFETKRRSSGVAAHLLAGVNRHEPNPAVSSFQDMGSGA